MREEIKILEVLDYLPAHMGDMVRRLPQPVLAQAEEIRLRLGKPLCVAGCNFETYVSAAGKAVEASDMPYKVSAEDLKCTIQLVCNFSMYSVEEELRNGFVTVSGGHRVGVSGKAVMEKGRVKTLKDISYMNFRIAKQIIGASDKVIGCLIRPQSGIYNTLIISPPQCGKTTMLRDIIRKLSSGCDKGIGNGMKISLVDERSEIAACSLGVPRNDVGNRTDVLDGCPKAEGIIMMIRSMSPDIVATDEIGRREDADAIIDAVNAGVKVITTIHGSGIEDFLRKKDLGRIQRGVFERYLILSKRRGVGTLEAVLDENHQTLYSEK
jgi:stage III sporulation protein AA